MSIMDHKHECSADDPWDRSKSFYGIHPDADCLEEHDKDGAGVYLCPHCGLQFREWKDS